MEVHDEGVALNLHRHVPTYSTSFNFIVVANKHMHSGGGLNMQSQGLDQVLLHEIVSAPAVDQDHDVVVSDPTHHAQGFRGGVARKCVEANLGLNWVGVLVSVCWVK